MGWMPAAGSDLGDRVRRRLEQDRVAWLTSVGADGTPQPNPVWFIVEGEEILVWNAVGAHRLTHLRSRPRVALNFNSTRSGGDILVITGEAHFDATAPLPHEVPAYVEKYGADMKSISGSLEAFSEAYPHLLRIRPKGVRA
jgi:PPOX class probable F420-dependent enzyme